MNRQELLRVAEKAREIDAVDSAIVTDFGTESDCINIEARYVPEIIREVVNTEGGWISTTRATDNGTLCQTIMI